MEALRAHLQCASARLTRPLAALCCGSGFTFLVVFCVFAARQHAQVAQELCPGVVVDRCPWPGVAVGARCFYSEHSGTYEFCSRACGWNALFFAEVDDLETWHHLNSQTGFHHFNAINARKDYDWYKRFGARCPALDPKEYDTLVVGDFLCQRVSRDTKAACLCTTSL